MIAYLLGLATIPALYMLARIILWLTDSTRSWIECGWCNYKTTTKWDRLKRLQMRRHEDRQHRAAIATFKTALAKNKDDGMDERDAYFAAIRAAKKWQKGAL